MFGIHITPGQIIPDVERTVSNDGETAGPDITTFESTCLVSRCRPYGACAVGGVIIRIYDGGKLLTDPGDPEAVPSAHALFVRVVRVVHEGNPQDQESDPDVLEDVSDTFTIADHANGIVRGTGTVLFLRNTLTDIIVQPGQQLRVLSWSTGGENDGKRTYAQLLGWPLVAVSNLVI